MVSVSGIKAQMLQALRSGNLSTEQIGERWGRYSDASDLVRMGYAEWINAEFRITDLGRANCPSRRPAKQAPQSIDAPIKKPALETIKLTSAIDIEALTKLTSPIFAQPIEMIKGVDMSTKNITTEKPKSRTLLVLEYIEAHPGCTGAEINDLVSGAYSYIKHHIEKNKVICLKIKRGSATYRLADGYTADSIYNSKASTAAPVLKPDTDYQISTKSLDFSNLKREDIIANSLNKSEINTSNFDPPKFLNDPWAKPAETAQSGSFRVAYTNDGCLMLLGLQYAPIELNAAQTNDLIDFISETITPIGVAI
jgi:hypothetical protein